MKGKQKAEEEYRGRERVRASVMCGCHDGPKRKGKVGLKSGSLGVCYILPSIRISRGPPRLLHRCC